LSAATLDEQARAVDRHRRLAAAGLVWRRKGVTLRRCRRGLIAFPTSDKYIGAALEHHGEVNENDFTLLRSLVGRNDWVVDAGANIGVYSLFFSERVGPTGLVISFEPQAQIAGLLQTNLSLNQRHRTLVWRCGLGDAQGRLSLPPIDYRTVNNFGGISLRADGEGAPVEVRTLDSFALRRCDLLKADVEGMEPAVVAGALATIRRFRPVLWLEGDRLPSRQRVLTALTAEGYHCWLLRILGERPRNFYRRPANFFRERDGKGYFSAELLCLPPGRPEPAWLATPPHWLTVEALP
jgi:FkbM family methyltransferase